MVREMPCHTSQSNTIIIFILPSLTLFQTALKVGTTAKGKDIKGKEPKAQLNFETVEAPDFYWKFRLERLVDKKGKELSFNEASYPEVKGYKDLYDSYYLDLTLQNKLVDFDREAEQKITESDWLSIYKSICQWSSKMARKTKVDPSALPENDIDLVKMFFPNLDTRDLDADLDQDAFGDAFPYKNMKELFHAASTGTLKIQPDAGYLDKVSSSPAEGKSPLVLDMSEGRRQLEELKNESLAALEIARDEALALARNPFPDDLARQHYREMKMKLDALPSTPAQWEAYEADMLSRIDEMAKFASRRVEEEGEHHEHHDDHADGQHAKPVRLTPAEEFQNKYGRNLDEVMDNLSKYKADPDGFLEASILSSYGKKGVETWRKIQAHAASLTDAETVQRLEQSMTDILNSA
jgi:hypothetical protein